MDRTYRMYTQNQATKTSRHQEPVLKKTNLKTLRNEKQNWSVPPSDALTFTSSSLFLLLITTIEPQHHYVNVSS